MCTRGVFALLALLSYLEKITSMISDTCLVPAVRGKLSMAGSVMLNSASPDMQFDLRSQIYCTQHFFLILHL